MLGLPDAGRRGRAKWDVGFVAGDMRLFLRRHWPGTWPSCALYPGWDEPYAMRCEALPPHAEQRMKELSSGEHVKALLLLALARRPRLLVLDEPTSGLDPVARHEAIGELMEVLQDEERSILFSSHNTVEVEQICDQITFLDRGRLVASDDKEAFVDRWRRLLLELPAGRDLPALPGVVEVTHRGQQAVVTANAFGQELLAALEQAGASVREVQRMTLEEIFVASVMHERKERGE